MRRDKSISKQINKFLEGITPGQMTVCAAALLIVSLIPLLWLGRYNVMCIDDYDYGRQVHDTWLATGSYLESVQTAWRQNMEFYQNWQGTYVSCFLMALCPMNFHYEIAWIVPVIMIGMFASSTFVLGRHILTKWLGADRTASSFIMLLLLFMFYQILEAPFEGIYWYNGSTHYILMQSVWFFTLAAVSGALWTKSRKLAVLYSVVAAALAVVVGGGNLITGLQAEILMVFLLLYAMVKNRSKIWAVCLPLVTGSIGFLCNTMGAGESGEKHVGSFHRVFCRVVCDFVFLLCTDIYDPLDTCFCHTDLAGGSARFMEHDENIRKDLFPSHMGDGGNLLCDICYVHPHTLCGGDGGTCQSG